MDPSQDSWFEGAVGISLSPMEIRAVLAVGGDLALNPDADYNGGPFDLDYLHYLAKNFYHMSCNLDQGPGYDAKGMARDAVILSPTKSAPPIPPIVRGKVARDSAANWAVP